MSSVEKIVFSLIVSGIDSEMLEHPVLIVMILAMSNIHFELIVFIIAIFMVYNCLVYMLVDLHDQR